MPEDFKNIIELFPSEIKNLLYESIFHESILNDNHSDYIFLIFIEYLTFILSFHRVRIVGKPIINKSGNPPSMFTMSFMPSGARKDYGLMLVEEKIFKKQFKKIDNLIKNYVESLKTKIQNDAELRYTSNTDNGAIQKQSYIDRMEEKIRSPHVISRGSTMEGIHADRKVFGEMGKGASFYFVKEISNYYSRYSDQKSALDSYLLESSETGTTSDKSIKSDKEIKEIKNVPVSVHMHGTIESNKLPQALQTFLKDGAARRIFVFFSNETKVNKKLLTMSREELIEYFTNETENKPTFKNIKKLLNKLIEKNKGKKYKISDKVAINYQVEQFELKHKSGVVSAHEVDIPWRALKISAPLQVLINSDSEYIEETTYNLALIISKYYSKFYSKLMEYQEAGIYKDVIDYISTLKNKTITLSKLKRKFKENIKNDVEFTSNLDEYAIDNNITLQINSHRGGAKFQIID